MQTAPIAPPTPLTLPLFVIWLNAAGAEISRDRFNITCLAAVASWATQQLARWSEQRDCVVRAFRIRVGSAEA